MIFGIGVDIAETARVEKLCVQYGGRFARRILTQVELAEFDRRNRPSKFLATRFAAKEAVAKAFGTGIGKALGFHSIQIENDSNGKPNLTFLGNAAELATRHEIRNSLISLSDEKHYVVAMVVLEA